MRKQKPRLPQTNAQLQRLVREWQKRLRLQDWVVQARFADDEEAKKRLDGAWGCTRVSSGLKEAVIYIARPADVPKEAVGCSDIEATLVHELLHLHADTFDHLLRKKRPTEYFGLETMIDTSAIALVELKRGTSRREWS